MKKKKVLVCILTMGDIHHILSQSISQMIIDSRKQNEYTMELYYSGIINVSDNRNGIVKRFLASDYDYLLMIDSDNPPIRNPLELVRLDLDIVACPTPMYKEESIMINCFNIHPGGGYRSMTDTKTDLFECDRVGTGCILIARRVLEKIKLPFATWVDEDGNHLEGEDFTFCKKAKDAGFKVWGHWDYLCHHFKTVDLLDILKVMKKYKNS
jgi:hypothetical protein